jgi:Glycogen debranching enzyme N terminal
MTRFGKDVCRNLDSGLLRKWMETNAIGWFASGTINGCNTCRYHGLLVAATKPPVGRARVRAHHGGKSNVGFK